MLAKLNPKPIGEVDGHVRLFVYGTLMRDQPAAWLLRLASFEGAATSMPGYELVGLGAYPAMVASDSGVVRGETYRVPLLVLVRLDAYEKHPESYVRTTIALNDGSSADAYLMPRARLPRHAVPIGSGDWRGFSTGTSAEVRHGT